MAVQKFQLLDPSFAYAPTPNTSGKRTKTTLVVLHYTASDDFHSTVQWLCEPRAKASAHFVIGHDGEVAQLAALDGVTWHAGKSFWDGQPNVNSCSVGIEILNLGPLTQKADHSFVSAYGKRKVPPGNVWHGKHQTDRNCPYEHWEAYRPEQLKRVREIIAALRTRFPSIRDVVGHSDVAPGRKLDPGPALGTAEH